MSGYIKYFILEHTNNSQGISTVIIYIGDIFTIVH